ncbi:hypothetical protein ADIS_1743 [Lunatimonas lonarensis]|uniref:Uncharacterized protein n=1 Tax=Lunatimonas lonarensis TaxID=1232681 RepID=R7ZV08_9BACT|nr:hypothetical protein ADIS_1743 [Lunatimonas lonarensis]
MQDDLSNDKLTFFLAIIVHRAGLIERSFLLTGDFKAIAKILFMGCLIFLSTYALWIINKT